MQDGQRDAFNGIVEKQNGHSFVFGTTAEGLALKRLICRTSKKTTKATIRKSITLLINSPKFTARQQAHSELEKLGDLAEFALRTKLKAKPALELKQRVEALLQKVRADWLNPTKEQVRQLRAIEALEGMDTPAARSLMQTLAEGAPGVRLTREARASLDRRKRS